MTRSTSNHRLSSGVLAQAALDAAEKPAAKTDLLSLVNVMQAVIDAQQATIDAMQVIIDATPQLLVDMDVIIAGYDAATAAQQRGMVKDLARAHKTRAQNDRDMAREVKAKAQETKNIARAVKRTIRLVA